MRWNAFWGVLGLSLLAVGTCQEDTEDIDGAQKQYKVSISGTSVELTCPLESEDNLKWEKDDRLLPNKNDKQLVLSDFSEARDSGYYVCYEEGSKKNKYLYLKARVCENCMEVDLTTVAIIIIVDICITLGLLMVVYYWSKNRKAKAKPVSRATGAGGRPRGQNKERPPPVPNPDYEPIRKGQRDLYSGLNQRAI
ncbi:T-cell surface glycoprotein CD3 epsilon chain [Grammomys surdaster]|uniref:T-cell surface glycoprotein CD3 epsilon chain n=1 Tax=Grammomys surdaster TaxID=491861 RepID=UPI00109F2531|nr:T-cell surface glycoprotein CD3 epsilon chain [Grammomys surdaster]